jgi:hypothetical protein
MSNPSPKEINDVLDKLEPVKWQSDAEREGLPRTNIHHSGAPLLDREKVLNRADVGRLVGKK